MTNTLTDIAVPAGWYADPTGLPQLRWWDSTAWSEHVHSQETPSVASAAPLAVATNVEASGFLAYVSEHDTGSHPTAAFDPSRETLQTGPAAIQRAAFMSSASFELMKQEEDRHPAIAHTGAVWMLALTPIFQSALAFGILYFLPQIGNFRLSLAIVVLPYIWSIGLAYADRKALVSAGHYSTAHWSWAILSPLLYLAIRTVRVHRLARRGSAPLWTWITLSAAQAVAAVVLAPMIFTLISGLFSIEVAHTVESSVAGQGIALTVTCPVDAPLTIGSVFQCAATHDTGHAYAVNVHVNDLLGGNTWQLTDDGSDAAQAAR
jgi:Protein of unknown function (DUF2510)